MYDLVDFKFAGSDSMEPSPGYFHGPYATLTSLNLDLGGYPGPALA